VGNNGSVADRALSFGSVASDYERFRPAYPDVVVDEVLAYAGRRIGTALEIGAGTGHATRVFAGRGIAVTATDPDPAMLLELSKQVPQPVTVVRSSFEALPHSPDYDLVFAAASLHWTEPEGRWEHVASMLRPQGIFASFGGPVRLADPTIEQVVRDARSEFLAHDDVPSPDGTPATARMQWPGTELTRSDLFADVRQLTIERRLTMKSPDYIGHLSTVSAYVVLPARVRRRVLCRILDVLPSEVELDADITVHLARAQ